MASSDPNKHGRIHKALSSLSGSALVGLVTNFLQSVSTSGWAAAAAGLSPVTAGAVLVTAAIFGISQACEGKAERKRAADLAKEFEKLKKQEGQALDLLNKIADGKIGVTLDWFTQEELAERTAAMVSGNMDELLASVLESQQIGFATLKSRLAELCGKLDLVASVQVSASGQGATAIGGDLVIKDVNTVIIGSPGVAPAPIETTEPPAPPSKPAPASVPSPSVKVSTGHLPVTGLHLFGRDAMLEQLNSAWMDKQTNVFALVAGGGVGKSTLVNHWLADMGQHDYRGARRVYGHSFYSQGTSDGTASADSFFADALEWFGDPDPTKGTAWARGERLAELVRKERTLLILDGMEPLQFPPGPNAGRVTDPGLQALLRELAAQNPGLCVVSTRVHVVDLDKFKGAGATEQDLDDLPNEAGANLLMQLGATGPCEEMEEASEEFGNHALALTLLGTYLVKACGGDIRRRTEISLVDADKMHGGHARKVMASYEKWFTEHGREAELSILRMLGLFNRPAEAGCVAALRGGEPIAELTEGLSGISEDDWNIALSNLREAGLLAKEDEENRGVLDAHPLVREHFAERLEKEHPKAWKAGHDRLYEYLTGDGCKKDLPDTAEEMAPLYAAVLHGCAAARHDEALAEVYWRRIRRQKEAFGIHKLGAFGADLGALAGFFEERWRRPVSSLSNPAHGFVRNEAGYDLRALGRLTEAVEPMLAGFEAAKGQENWNNAAAGASFVSELYLTLGRIVAAIGAAEQSIDFANRSGDAFQRLGKRTTLADAFHQARRPSEAQALFHEAERMQQDYEPRSPLLYGLAGYRYCDFLLGHGDHEKVIERATNTIEIAKRNHWLLDIALDHLSLGRAYLLQSWAEGTCATQEARAHLDLAVDGLREAGQQDDLPRGLLARAELYMFTDDHADARAALNEAMDIATRDPQGHMKLFVTDCHLGYARLALAEKKPDVARKQLAQARALIEDTGYHRRDAELAELTEAVGGPNDPGT